MYMVYVLKVTQRSDMKLTWSISDQKEGTRTIKEIIEKSKLAKRNRHVLVAVLYNFSSLFLYSVHHDSLYLFLKISDYIINMLLRDLTILDGVEKAQKMDGEKGQKYSMSYFYSNLAKFISIFIIHRVSKPLNGEAR